MRLRKKALYAPIPPPRQLSPGTEFTPLPEVRHSTAAQTRYIPAMARSLLDFAFALLTLPLFAPAWAADVPAPVAVLAIEGAIGPAIGDFIERGLAKAQKSAPSSWCCRWTRRAGSTPRCADHQGHPGLAGAGGRLRRAERRAGRERRHLHPLREPRCGDGARHQPRRRDADRHRSCRRRAAAAEPERGGPSGDGKQPQGSRGPATTTPCRQAHQRRRRPTSAASPSCAGATPMGRAGGARVGQPVRDATRWQRKVIDVVAADLPDLLRQLDGRAVPLGDRRRQRDAGHRERPGRDARRPIGAPGCSR